MRFQKFGMWTDKILLDVSARCQLSCPECPGKEAGGLGIVGKGDLKFANFKQLVDDNPFIRQIEISSYGEVFLNRQLKEIVEYAFEKNITLTADNGVNLNNATDEILETIVKCRVKSLSVSIDGASNETYSIYRRGGNFDTVIENIQKINAHKKQLNSESPRLIWNFIVFGHNEHEISKARKMAEELNMTFALKYNEAPDYSPIKDEELVRKEMGFSTAQQREQETGNAFFMFCGQLWLEPQINWDGKVLGCCINKWQDFGNAFEQPLKKILKSQQYRHTQKVVTGKANPRKDTPCTQCRFYKRMKEINSYYRPKKGLCKTLLGI